MSYDLVPFQLLTEQFEKLPGVGHKSAQRMAFAILSKPVEEVELFAKALTEAKAKIRRCNTCCNLTEEEICPICGDDKRDDQVICVVEDPRDVLAFERLGEFRGRYHVLHGLLNPMEGILPDQLTIRELMKRLTDERVQEVILATNPTVNGEATVSYLTRLIKPFGIKVTRLAYGLPVGGNLEFADEVTLTRALDGRTEL